MGAKGYEMSIEETTSSAYKSSELCLPGRSFKNISRELSSIYQHVAESEPPSSLQNTKGLPEHSPLTAGTSSNPPEHCVGPGHHHTHSENTGFISLTSCKSTAIL